MQLFTMHDILNALWLTVSTYREISGAMAVAAIDTALQPLHHLTIGTFMAAIGAVLMLWRKKSWILSGLVHVLYPR